MHSNDIKIFAANFEDLRIWQEARKLVKEIYKNFRLCKNYSFCDQIQRATLSIMNNIAEGFGRKTKKDFAHFLDLAKGSSHEVKSMTYAAEDLGYLSCSDATMLREQLTRLILSIGALGSKLRQSSSQK
jgi:four helix bundle protein